MLGFKMIDIVIMSLGVVTFFIWLIFYFKGKQYNDMFEGIEEKEFPLREIYGLGYAVLETVKYKYQSKNDRKLRQALEILYSPKYCEYYLRVVRAQQISVSFTLLVLAFSLYGLVGDMSGFGVGVMFSALAFYYFGTEPSNKIKKRSDQLLSDFSDMVSKLALLTNAGMVLHDAWKEIAYGAEGELYKEMRLACDEMENGVSDIDAVYSFGNRCIIPEIKKFSSTVIQGILMGNAALSKMLQDQNAEVWMLKKQLVKRQGEKAASKLLIPVAIMFVGILIMIIVPIFTNLGA